jgi:tetrahydromethanopterin S-methyltransferase subunit E
VRVSYQDLIQKRSQESAFWVLGAFVPTFLLARLVVYLLPSTALHINGTHIHHFAYGFVLLAIGGFAAVVHEGKPLRWAAFMYGAGLALVADEAGIWLRLDAHYYVRLSYDAVVFVGALLVSAVYFRSFWMGLARLFAELLRSIRRHA